MTVIIGDVEVVHVSGLRDEGVPIRVGTKSLGRITEPSCGRDEVASRNRIVQENLGLVRRVARQFQNRGLMIEDLVGEGVLGLIRAADRYDPAMGARFSTYATYWIRDAIQTALANTAGTIRLPMNVWRLMARWVRTESLLWQVQGHSPTFDEVAAAMGLDGAAQSLVARAHQVTQLQMQKESAGEELSPVHLMCDEGQTAEEFLSAREEREWISRRMERLDDDERAAVSLRYGLSGEPAMSLVQIGDRLGLSAASVQKVIGRAMRKLGQRPLRRRDAPAASARGCVG